MNKETEKLKEAHQAGLNKLRNTMDYSNYSFPVELDKDSEDKEIAMEFAINVIAIVQPRLDLLKEKVKKCGVTEEYLQYAIELGGARGRGRLICATTMQKKDNGYLARSDIDYAQASKTDYGIFNLFEDYDSISTDLASKRLKKTKRAIINSTNKLIRKGILITNSESESKYSPFRRYKLNPDKTLEELKVLLLTPEREEEE